MIDALEQGFASFFKKSEIFSLSGKAATGCQLALGSG